MTEIPAGDIATDWWSILAQSVTTFAALLTIFALLFAAFMWMVKPRAKAWVEGIAAQLDATEKNTRQLTPNAGKHLHDAVTRIETKVDDAAIKANIAAAEARENRGTLNAHIRVADKTVTLYRHILSQKGIELPEVRDE